MDLTNDEYHEWKINKLIAEPELTPYELSYTKFCEFKQNVKNNNIRQFIVDGGKVTLPVDPEKSKIAWDQLNKMVTTHLHINSKDD